MKTINFKVLLVLLFTTLTACGSSHEGTDSNTATVLTATSLRYFKGDAMTWSYDLTIDFTNPAAFQVTSKTQDATCMKTGVMTPDQSVQLNHIVNALVLARTTAPEDPNATDEWVEFSAANNFTSQVYLLSAGAPTNSVYATDGTDLSNFMQALDASLTEVCQ